VPALNFFPHVAVPVIERLGLVILVLGPKQFGRVVVVGRNGGMILAENLFLDLDGSTKERLGLLVLALGMKQKGEVVIIPSNVGMILAENLFVDHDGPTMERLSLRVAREILIRKCQVVQRRFSVIWAKC